MFVVPTKEHAPRISNNYHTPKMKWSKEEDELLTQVVKQYGTKKWTIVAAHVPGRTGKQCRERWITNLDPEINKNQFSFEEDSKLLELYQQHGSKWAYMVQFFEKRTAIHLKNRWKWIEKKGLFNDRKCVLSPQEVSNLVNSNDKITITQAEEYFNEFSDHDTPNIELFNTFFDDTISV